MTIKELKKIIKNLPDDMKVGGSGYMGEYLECYGIRVDSVGQNYWRSLESGKEDILVITLESAGEPPE